MYVIAFQNFFFFLVLFRSQFDFRARVRLFWAIKKKKEIIIINKRKMRNVNFMETLDEYVGSSKTLFSSATPDVAVG